MTTKLHTSSAVCRLAGITYRQLDYWTRRGWVRPATAHVGSGRSRGYSDDELERAQLIAKLVRAGLPPLQAYRATRRGDYDETGVFRAPLHGPVTVEVSP